MVWDILRSESEVFLMDNQKFGQFIQQRRKEKGWTQQQLAEKLYVTDKAVSKWERGISFPDIRMIEPLAEVLDVSVAELMCGEKHKEETQNEHATEAVENVIDVAIYQKQAERRKLLLTVAILTVGILLVFLVDTMQWMGVFMVCLPILSLLVGIYLTGLSVYRARKKQTYRGLRIAGIIAMGIPVLQLLLICIGVVCGTGPVPS